MSEGANEGRRILAGQKVTKVKVERSRELRQKMTHEERILWNHLRAGRLDGWHFHRQQVIDGFIVDFYCHAAGLYVEVDGGVHAAQAEYDETRDTVLTARGLTALRVTNEQVRFQLGTVLESIRSLCAQSKLPPL